MSNYTNSTPTENLIELRSEKVRKAIGPIPKGIVIAGYIAILLIIVALLCALIFIPYPYGNGESILQHLLQ